MEGLNIPVLHTRIEKANSSKLLLWKSMKRIFKVHLPDGRNKKKMSPVLLVSGSLWEGLTTECGLIHVFKAGSGCGLNAGGIFISLTFGCSFATLSLQAKQTNKLTKQSKWASVVHFSSNQCDSWLAAGWRCAAVRASGPQLSSRPFASDYDSLSLRAPSGRALQRY